MDLDGDVGTLDPNFIALNVCVMQLQEYVRRTRGELLKRNVNLKDDAKVNRERHDEQFRILRKMVEEQAETIERLQYEDAQIKKRDRDEITSLQKQVDDLNKRVSRLEQEVVEGKKHGRKLENRIRDAVQPIQAQLDDLNYISRR
jgi:predicted RNase H-like nuclease (RuvC/YqgF family)